MIATVSGDVKAAEARRAGADEVINYKTENVAERVKALTRGAGVDHVVEVDFGANLATTLAVLKSNGSVATYASMAAPDPAIPFYPLMFKNVHLLWVFVYEMPAEAMVAAGRDVNAWLATGTAVHPQTHRFALEQMAAAHVAVEQGVIGKVLVRVSATD